MCARARKAAAALAATLALCACDTSGGAKTLAQAQSACASGASHAEVVLDGRVLRVLGTRDSRSGMHEGFIIESGGTPLKVEDNTDLTGPIPLSRGEAVSLRGQYECDDAVIHWTHRDPRGRHLDGYVIAGGRTYR